MTAAVGPRSASVPPAPSSPPVAVDRSSTQRPPDFEMVLRGRGSRRAVSTHARADDRREGADSSTPDDADHSATTDPAAGVQPVGTQPVQATVPPAADPGTSGDRTTAGAPGPVATGAAVSLGAVGLRAVSLGDAASSARSGPAASSGAASSSSSTGHPAPPVGIQPVGARPVGARSDPAAAQALVAQAPTSGAASAAPTATSPLRRADPAGGGGHGSDGGDAAAPAAASMLTDPTAYPLAPPGGAPVGVDTPVPAPTDSRPAQATLPPQAQLLNAVSPLVTSADGTHRLTVHLAPAHLGSVQVHLEVTAGEVTLRLTVADPATGDALRQGAAELRSHLEHLGLRSGGIEVQVAPGDQTRDLPGRTPPDPAALDSGDRGSHQPDSGPWAEPPTAGGPGDGPPDGGWRRHELPLDGWASRHADGKRPILVPPQTPPDPHRPPAHDVRVDLRM